MLHNDCIRIQNMCLWIGASDWMQSTDEVSNNWKGVPNLVSGTSYEVRLAVTNGKSQSTSDVQYVKTRGIGTVKCKIFAQSLLGSLVESFCLVQFQYRLYCSPHENVFSLLFWIHPFSIEGIMGRIKTRANKTLSTVDYLGLFQNLISLSQIIWIQNVYWFINTKEIFAHLVLSFNAK